MPSGDCSAGLEEAVAYLVQYNGDFEMARDCLIRDTFLGRIWNSDEHSLAYDEDDIYQMPRRRLDENLIQRLKDDSIHYEVTRFLCFFNECYFFNQSINLIQGSLECYTVTIFLLFIIVALPLASIEYRWCEFFLLISCQGLLAY